MSRPVDTCILRLRRRFQISNERSCRTGMRGLIFPSTNTSTFTASRRYRLSLKLPALMLLQPRLHRSILGGLKEFIFVHSGASRLPLSKWAYHLPFVPSFYPK